MYDRTPRPMSLVARGSMETVWAMVVYDGDGDGDGDDDDDDDDDETMVR